MDTHVAIRVVLADDHYLVREGVRRLLETEPEIEVAAVCDDLDSLLAAVDAGQADVVLSPAHQDAADTASTRASRPRSACG